MQSYVIGIDLGTGSVKAIAMNYSGDVIDTAQVSYPTLQPLPGYQEQEPERLWQAFKQCISHITAHRKNSPDAVCLSSAMHSLIPVSAKGEPLMNMMTWADNRSASIATDIHRSAAAQLLYEETGTPIHAMSPLCKIQWLKTREGDLFSKTDKFISIKEYIWYKLFGHYEVDYSIASASGLFNINDLAWNDLSLDTCSISLRQLSTPVNADHKRMCNDPVHCRQMGIAAGTPFLIGASDGCLANVGSFATKEGSMALTIGTSGAVRIARKKPMLNFKAMTFNYRLDDSTFICGGPTNNGGAVLKWYAENFLGKKLATARDYEVLLDGVTASNPGAEGLVFLPYVWGERAPIWNSDACGVFFGIRSYHQPAHFTRAIVEGISMAVYDIADNMMETGLDVKHINVSGGFVHSGLWLQTLANIFGKRICLIHTADASATGAAFVALKNLGAIHDYLALKPKDALEYLPDTTSMSAYRELFHKYRNLYKNVAGLMTG